MGSDRDRARARARARARTGAQRDVGAGTLEYLGIVVVAALLVVGVVTAVARADLGVTIACELRSIASQSGSCGVVDTPTTYGGDGVGAAGPRGAAGQERGTGGGADAGPDYANATSNRPAADADRVTGALDQLRDALDGGFWGVSGGDLDDAKRAIDGLNGAEVDALVADMSDDELKQWVDELDDGWLFGGWSREERRDLWEVFAGTASRTTLDRLAQFTDELEPAFDEVGGDGARDNPESPANSGEYGEIPHQLIVDGIAAQDVNQGQIGDCWYVASMMAVAQANPALLEKAITANANGSYTVRLYDDGQPVDVTVTPEMVLDDGSPAFVQNPQGEAGYELWPMVLEKALAQQWGDFSEIEGDSPGLGIELLTGQTSERRDLADAGGVTAIADYLDQGGAITLSSFTESDGNPDIYDVAPASGGLAANHAYYVSAVDTEGGTVTVTNPWGSRYPVVIMTYADFEKNFSNIYFNGVSS